MTKITRLTFLAVIMSTSLAAEQSKCNRLEQANWLLGDWQQQKGERLTLESWQQIDNRNFIGESSSRKLNSDKPAFVESLRLVEMSGGIFYLAKTPQNEMPVAFKLIECADKLLKFENRSHDFPQSISYKKITKDHLLAEVRGAEKDGKTSGFDVNYSRKKR